MSTEISSYQQQGLDFLAATETTFSAKFLKFGYHFNDDNHPRNIFRITLKNRKGKYSFDFGSSIADSCEKIPTKNFYPQYSNKQAKDIIYPTPYDVLASIQKYEIGSFDDFCNEFGYFPINSSEDLKNAKKTYKAVLREWKNIEILFTTDQIELLQVIA